MTTQFSAARLRALVVVLALVGLAAACDPPAGTQDWAMFGHDATHSGLTTETKIDATNAASLGLKWQANTGQPAFSSPVVAWSSTLNKSLVYVGNSGGVMSAFDALTGNRVWTFKTGARIDGTAAVANGVVYFGSNDKQLYALDAATGAKKCVFLVQGSVSGSPVVVNPDGQGTLVYFGDHGASGSDDGGHVWAVNGVDSNSAADCTKKWSFNSYGNPAGSKPLAGTWSPPAYAKDKDGRGLIVFGGSSPDDAVYAVNALTGARVWRFQANPGNKPDADVGTAPTISAPGVNGFADGVVYISGKENAEYALNLRTGAKIWRFDMSADLPGLEGAARSAAALVNDRLFVGYGAGIYHLNAKTGAKVWRSSDHGPASAEVISAVAATGADGKRAFIVGDLAGKVLAFAGSTGARLFSYQTGDQIYASAAISNGTAFITSTDGFLYAFALGGPISGAPNTTITAPVDGSTVANPNGNLPIGGSADDDSAVSAVLFSVRRVTDRTWWKASTGTWEKVFTQNSATLANPGAANTTWSGSFPVPFGGGPFEVEAEAVDPGGQHDPTTAASTVSIRSRGFPGKTTITYPAQGQVVPFPGGTHQSFPIVVRGSATDTGGANPGIKEVHVVIQNIEHGEYFCGGPGCDPFVPGNQWNAGYTEPTVTLASPNAVTTNWSISVPMYDHPHSYSITAWAIDLDGEIEQLRPTTTFCVRDPGVTTCS